MLRRLSLQTGANFRRTYSTSKRYLPWCSVSLDFINLSRPPNAFASVFPRSSRLSHQPSFRYFFSSSNGDDYERYRRLSDDVIKLIRHENDFTLQSIDQGLKRDISQEILDAYESGEDRIPELGPTGRYLYRAEDDSKGKRRYFRQHVDSGEEQLVLSINFQEYQLHAMSLSVNEAFLAYLLSPVASPSQTIVKIRHIGSQSGHVLPTNGTTVSNIEFGPIQADGSDSLFWTTLNDKGRPCSVYACSVDSEGNIGKSRWIYRNDDESVMVDVQRTKGCKYVAIYASEKTSSEIYLVEDVESSPILVRRRQEGVLYHVDVGVKDDDFLLAHASEPEHESNLSEEMTLFETTVSLLPLQSDFGTEYGHKDVNYAIADMDIFNDFIALYERSTIDGRHRIRLLMRSETSAPPPDVTIPLPEECGDCTVLSTGGNMFYHSKQLRFRTESPCNPGRTYSFDTATGDLQALSGETALSPYTEKRVFVTSKDGTQVPMSLLYLAKDAEKIFDKKVPVPTVLIGYGAYGEPVCHGFDPTIIPLLNRGFVIAYAHTRGGGELGREWYRGGRLYEKERAIDDYIACAETLVGSLAVSEPLLLTGKAFSAGGVVVAAAVNRQPSLFGCVVLTNPFLDVITAMTDTKLALTEHEWTEWGDVVRDFKAKMAVSSYCPMTNVASQDYPKMLIVGTIDDKNVPYWHPLTFALKIRNALDAYETMATQTNPEMCATDTKYGVLLDVEQSGGHHLHGTKLDVSSMETAFIIQCTASR